jgi:hypothetical protein
MSAGSREDADSTAPDLQHDWCSECEHQYTAVVGFIKGEGTYPFGGLQGGERRFLCRCPNRKVWRSNDHLSYLDRIEQSEFQLLITVDRFHDDCLDEVVEKVFVYAPCRYVVTHVFHFSKEAVGAVQVAV